MVLVIEGVRHGDAILKDKDRKEVIPKMVISE